MYGDCLSRYLAYKEACTDDIVPIDPALIQNLTSTTGQDVYKRAVRQLIDAEECLGNRRWVRDKCYPDQRDRGHDIAIEIAETHRTIAEQNCRVIAEKLAELKKEQMHRRTNIATEKNDQSEEAISITKSKKKKKKKNQPTSPLPASPTIDTEEWYQEVADRKKQINEQTDRTMSFSTFVILSYLDKGKSSRHKWLRKLLTVPHVIQHLTDMLPMPRSNDVMAALLENVTSMNTWRSTLEDGLKTFLALSITPRTIIYSTPEEKKMETDILFKKYEHNDDLTLQYALETDMKAIAIFTMLAKLMRLNALSTESTGLKGIKFSYPPHSTQRLVWINGIVTLARFFHQDKSDDYLKEHIEWHRMPRTSKDTADDFLLYFQDFLI